MRTVMTILNGQLRPVFVRDRSVTVETKAAEKADASKPGQVAAPFSGVVTLKVERGPMVAAGESVATIEAMKMEAAITLGPIGAWPSRPQQVRRRPARRHHPQLPSRSEQVDLLVVVDRPVNVREIRLFGDPVLKTASEPVGDIDDRIRGSSTTCSTACELPGRAGVAACQIGVNLRAFSYNVDGESATSSTP